MQTPQKPPSKIRPGFVFPVVLLLFIAGSGNTSANSSYHLGYGIHNYGYHGGHYSIGAHYSSHGGVSTAGYIILGLFGAVLLTHIFNENQKHYGTYHRSTPYPPPVAHQRPVPRIKTYSPVPSYAAYEGWDALTKGNAGFALDIFAVQIQENMSSGVPRVGFALAAAAGGELDRAARSMRKALSIDPDALNQIHINDDLGLMIELLIEEYTGIAGKSDPDFDYSFMIASLACLKHDYVTARNSLENPDQSSSAENLRDIINTYL